MSEDLRAEVARLTGEVARLGKTVDTLIENELRKSGERHSVPCKVSVMQVTDNPRTNGQFRLVCENPCIQRCTGFQGCVRCNLVLNQVQDR